LESAREKAKRRLKELEGELDMTPKPMSTAFKMDPALLAESDSIHQEQIDTLDTIIEGARFDLRRMPDVTGAIYGYFVCGVLNDPYEIAGLLGEALLRLAKMPDMIDQNQETFEKLVEDLDADTDGGGLAE